MLSREIDGSFMSRNECDGRFGHHECFFGAVSIYLSFDHKGFVACKV